MLGVTAKTRSLIRGFYDCIDNTVFGCKHREPGLGTVLLLLLLLLLLQEA